MQLGREGEIWKKQIPHRVRDDTVSLGGHDGA